MWNKKFATWLLVPWIALSLGCIGYFSGSVLAAPITNKSVGGILDAIGGTDPPEFDAGGLTNVKAEEVKLVDAPGKITATDTEEALLENRTLIDQTAEIAKNASSPMVVTGGVLSDGTNAGTFKVSPLTASLRTSDSEIATLVMVSLSEQDNQAITVVDTTYYVILNLSLGSPSIQISTSTPANEQDIPIGKVRKNASNDIHFIAGGFHLNDAARKIHVRAKRLEGFQIDSGMTIVYSGTNNFTSEAGSIYSGINLFSTNYYDSAITTFTPVYSDGLGGWTLDTPRNTIMYDNYDDGDGIPGDVGTAKFGNHWVYEHIDDGDVFVVLGLGSYSLAAAQAATEPPHPPDLEDFGILIAKIIVPQAGGSFESVEMNTPNGFRGTSPSNHPNLSGLGFVESGHIGFLGDSDFTQANSILMGTGAGTFAETAQQAAIDILTGVSGATNEWVLTKDTATGNAVFKVAAVPDIINFTLTTFANQSGMIQKNTAPFIHDFNYGDNSTVITDGENTFIGIGAGNFTMGSTATAITQSSRNVVVGYGAGNAMTTDYNCTYIGNGAGGTSIGNKENTFIGYSAGKNADGNYDLIAIGKEAALGAQNLWGGIYIGKQTGEVTSGSSYNVIMGDIAGKALTSGDNNTFIGYSAGNDATTASYNTFVGSSAGDRTTGQQNTIMGYRAGFSNVAGVDNVFIGVKAAEDGNGSSNNVVIGVQAGEKLTAGNNENVLIGTYAGQPLATGTGNVMLGVYAGMYYTGYSNNVSATDGVFLGKQSIAKASGGSNEIVIGSGATGEGSNSVVLGNDSITDTYLKGDLSVTGNINKVIAKTSSGTLTVQELNGQRTIHNDGAVGEVILTWATLALGQECFFYVNDAQYLQVKAPAATTIRIGTITTAANGYIRSDVVGNWVRVKAMPDGLVVMGYGGNWTYDE